ncbi:MAG: dockerin type I domain-containing protein [Fimbriimonadales bacterium]|nr:dockerin type I domain-containing protein [Fimbriimonadales bacterium]MDW8052317.1 dockerin type I domain-containing protein [Armatimonadota bacterium]
MSTMRLVLLLCGLVSAWAAMHAQNVAWSRLYVQPDSRGIFPQVAATDSQGNLIIAGRYLHSASNQPFNNVALIKYSPSGDLLWTRTIGLPDQAEYAEAIAVATDDSFYLAITQADNNSIAFVQRWSASGDLLWSVSINESSYDVVRQLIARPEGGVEVLHAFGSEGIGFARLIFDSNGNRLATNLYWQPNTYLANRTPVGMLRLNSTTTLVIFVDGEVGEILQGYSRTYLRAINSAGGTVYERIFPLRTEKFAQAGDGTLYLLGDYWDASNRQMRLRLCRVNPSNGNLLGQWDLGIANGDAIPDVLAVSDTVWLASGGWETAATRGMASALGLPNGTLLGTQVLEGVYRPVAGVGTASGALVQLVGELLPNPDRWKPALQWLRTDGTLMAQGYLPALSAADEAPELLVASPDGAVYAIATVNQGAQNVPAIGIWRVEPPPTLTGRITLQGYLPDPAGKTAYFTITRGSQTDTLTRTLGTGGTYSLQTGLSGTVQVRVYVPGWLGQRQTLTLSSSGVVTHEWTLIGGDVNRDNQINNADLLIVLFSFGTNDAQADVNGDGAVNNADLLLVLFNFGATGD